MAQTTMVGKDRDEDTGEFRTTFPDADFIAAIETVHPTTTRNICEEVSCAYRTAHERLTDLAEEGKVKREKIGQSLLWSIPEDQDNNSDTN